MKYRTYLEITNKENDAATLALLYSLKHKQSDNVKKILDAGIVSSEDLTCVLYDVCCEIRCNVSDIVQLVKHGADPNAVFSSGKSSIMEALDGGYYEIAKELYRNGGKIEFTDNIDRAYNILEFAGFIEDTELGKQALLHGASLDDYSFEFLVENGDVKFVDFLAKLGKSFDNLTKGQIKYAKVYCPEIYNYVTNQPNSQPTDD